MIIPNALNIGNTIGVMSPSSYISEDDLQKSIKIIEAKGYKVEVHPQTLARHNQSAGTDSEKLNALHDLVRNPNIDAIIFSTGGNRAMNWVDHIDFDLIRQNPKIIMGFSDCTAPLNIINAKTGLVTFHGPNLRWFMVNADNITDTQQCFEILSGNYNNHGLNIQSPMIGGNLSLLQYLTNDLDFKNKTLLIEDWNIELSHLDRIFCHLRREGIFDKINQLIIGQFENLTDTGRPYGFTFEDILNEHIPPTLPVIKNAPFGHGSRLITFPIGLETKTEA